MDFPIDVLESLTIGFQEKKFKNSCNANCTSIFHPQRTGYDVCTSLRFYT